MHDVLHFLNQRIDYERIFSPSYTAREFKPCRMRDLLTAIGDPHLGMPILHVAGTKGKGSTSAAAAAILTAAGYRTGLFTSPHIDRVEERVVIDGEPCTSPQFAELLEQLVPAIESLDRRYAAQTPSEPGPTYFEITTAMALRHFAQKKVDIAVLEVGLGGRLDSTNVCEPLVSVITSISFDHTKQLGNTLEAIAQEKAGIIKPGIPVVSGVTDPGPREVVRQTCRDRDCRLVELGIDFDVQYTPPHGLESAPSEGTIDFVYRAADAPHQYSGVALGLLGHHQAANAAVALAALAQLRQTRTSSNKTWEIPEAAIRTGLRRLTWPARIELVARRPAIVIDGAHNVASVRALIEALNESFSARRRILVFASTQEKDIPGMLRELLGQFDEVILTQYTDNPRAVPVEDLAAAAAEVVGRTERSDARRDLPIQSGGPHSVRSALPGFRICQRPADAWKTARELAAPEDLICVTGSFYIAAQMRREVLAIPATAVRRPDG